MVFTKLTLKTLISLVADDKLITPGDNRRQESMVRFVDDRPINDLSELYGSYLTE